MHVQIKAVTGTSRHHAPCLIRKACPWVFYVKALISLYQFLIPDSKSGKKEQMLAEKRVFVKERVAREVE